MTDRILMSGPARRPSLLVGTPIPLVYGQPTMMHQLERSAAEKAAATKGRNMRRAIELHALRVLAKHLRRYMDGELSQAALLDELTRYEAEAVLLHLVGEDGA